MKKSNYSWISYCLIFISALGLLIGCPDPNPDPDPDLPIGTTLYVTIIGMPDGNGNNVTADPMMGPRNTEVTVTVIPVEGYRLKVGSLKYNDTVVPESLKFNLRNDVTITAEFELIPVIPPADPDFIYKDMEYNEETGKLLLKWDAVEGAARYEIYHAGSRLGEYELIATVTSAGNYTPQDPNPNKYENYYKVVAVGSDNTEISTKLISLEQSIFGPNTYFYDIKYDNAADIKAEIDSIHRNHTYRTAESPVNENGHWTNRRFAFYFKPGRYDYSGNIRIGFYTSVSGLGPIPTDTIISGVHVPPYLTNEGGRNVTQNFWMSIENLSVQAGTFNWSVSQAAPARRMHATVRTQFDWDNGWASGGYLSDSYHTGWVGTSSGQQFYARNNHFASAFNGGSWHRVIQATTGASHSTTSNGRSTYIENTPVIREKPFLYYDSDLEEYMVFVPALRREAVGTSWTIDGDMGEGEAIKLVSDKFYIARPSAGSGDYIASGNYPNGEAGKDDDVAPLINAALARGQHIFFTPGRYFLGSPLHVRNPNTVLLGTGYATLIPAEGNSYGAIYIDDVPGVTVASLFLDALYDSTYLLCAGEYGANRDHSANPTLLADVFFRVGGVKSNCNADISALINSNNVIGDHFWVWRADHGNGVGWTSNRTKNGVVVTGDDVSMYGLFVEHYHEYETLWLGENGRTYFYQNERPYDSVATTDDPENPGWQNPRRSDVQGWSAYKVANHVENHDVRGAGMYLVFRNNSRATSAMELPNKPGVTALNINTQRLTGNGAQLSILNGTGASSTGGAAYLHTYNDGVATGVGSAPSEGYDPDDEEFDIPTNLIP